jgi:hypothetical protein
MNDKEIQLIKKFINLGFKVNEAINFAKKHKLIEIKSWVLFEEIGMSIINEYSLSKIKIL